MTPSEFRAAREGLGVSQEELAHLLGVNGSRIIRKWEAGENAVPEPVSILMKLLKTPRLRRVVEEIANEPSVTVDNGDEDG